MEAVTHFLTLVTFLLLVSHAHPTSAAKASKASKNFIITKCNTTTYPALCTKTLTASAASVGTNPLKLCNAALKVAINATGTCSTTAAKLSQTKGITRREASAIKECIGDMKHAVYELKETVKAMSHLSDADREFQWANAKTYASAAITDAETCIDEVLEGKVNAAMRKKIRSCVSNVEKLMSNALSLINHLY